MAVLDIGPELRTSHLVNVNVNDLIQSRLYYDNHLTLHSFPSVVGTHSLSHQPPFPGKPENLLGQAGVSSTFPNKPPCFYIKLNFFLLLCLEPLVLLFSLISLLSRMPGNM